MYYILLLGLIASLLLIISIFRKPANSNRNAFLLIAADTIFIVLIVLFNHRLFNQTQLILMSLIYIVLNILAIRKMNKGVDVNQDLYDKWHNDPANWKAGVFYFNPVDKRLFPPKRIPAFGWTINFANPNSVLVFLVLISVIVLVGYIIKKFVI